MTHTPGPWDADAYEDGGFVILTSDGVVLASRNSWNHRAAESKDNAKLIAAAPDLLTALKHCLSEHGGFTIKGESERMALAAIAKATL